MNQQQATEFIQQQLQQGQDPEAIVQLLSQQLPAPPEMLLKFVEKVAAQMPPPPPVSQPARTAQPLQAPTQAYDALSSEPPAQAPVLAAATPAAPQPAATPLPAAASMPARPAARPNPLDDPKLTEYVVKRLKRQHRKSDIALEICERTGVDWKEAQRFVSQVNIEQNKSISSSKNLPILIFCGLFIFSGAILLIWGLLDMAPLVSLLFGMPTDQLYLSDFDIRGTIYLLLGGIGLTLGGLVGFYLAIRPQIE